MTDDGVVSIMVEVTRVKVKAMNRYVSTNFIPQPNADQTLLGIY